MNQKITITREQIRQILPEAKAEGGTSRDINGLAALAEAGPGDLSFLGNKKYRQQVAASRASVILLPLNYAGSPAPDQLYLRVANPSLALAQLCEGIASQLFPKPAPGIHPTAVVDATAAVARTASIGPLCVVEAGAVIGAGSVLEAQVFIGRGAQVGEDCWLKPQVALQAYCQLGRRVRLHAGVVIGADGFGYEETAQGLKKVPQVGVVVIEDDVEIGANSTVDRARLGETRVGQGTKIDNLVMIAHNVKVGRHCIIVSQVGVSGSATLEDGVVLGGQVGTVGHITIGRNSQVGGQAGVNHDLPPGSKVTGTPARPLMEMRRLDVLESRLPELFNKVAKLAEILEKKS